MRHSANEPFDLDSSVYNIHTLNIFIGMLASLWDLSTSKIIVTTVSYVDWIENHMPEKIHNEEDVCETVDTMKRTAIKNGERKKEKNVSCERAQADVRQCCRLVFGCNRKLQFKRQKIETSLFFHFSFRRSFRLVYAIRGDSHTHAHRIIKEIKWQTYRFLFCWYPIWERKLMSFFSIRYKRRWWTVWTFCFWSVTRDRDPLNTTWQIKSLVHTLELRRWRHVYALNLAVTSIHRFRTAKHWHNQSEKRNERWATAQRKKMKENEEPREIYDVIRRLEEC